MTEATTAMHAPTTATTTAADTAAGIVPPRPDVARPSRSTAVRLWVTIGALGALLALAVGLASVVDVPYATIAPGSAYATESLIRVDGQEIYAARGEVLFLTASVDYERVTLGQAVQGWIDPDIRVVPEELFLGDRTEQETDERAQLQMDSSKDVAIIVALSRLGHELNPTGTGATLEVVEADTPAAGILQVGDTIVAVDRAPVARWEEVGDAIRAHAVGDAITLTVEGADGSVREDTAALREHPNEPGVAFLGVLGRTRDFDPGLPFDVIIDSGSVGGPSAGLAFTLAVIDVLTPGELTGGVQVAVTGTIGSDGSVGTIDGVAQKAVAAAEAGAEIFIVPTANEDEARAHDHGMAIVPVDTLDEALAALAARGGDPLPPPA